MHLKLERISKTYDGRPVLAGVNVEVAKGECLLVYGPNGSGKSTLLRVMATLVPPTSGRLLFDGRSAGEWGPDLRRRIGVLLHESMLYDELSAEENLAWTARLYGIRPWEPVVRHALEQVGLERVRHQLTGKFSRGMKQRLSLARSLLADPELILWDEPYEGLDQRALDRVQQQLATLRARGKTMVIVAHQWERVWPYADRIVVLSGGRVRHQGVRDAVDMALWKKFMDGTAPRDGSKGGRAESNLGFMGNG